MHISLLEDDIAIQEMLQLVLQDEGFTISIYPTAEECLKALDVSEQEQRTLGIDLLIVDWRLPGLLSGIQVIQRVRAMAEFRSLPIILTTAATFHDTQELEGLQVILLEKPFAIDDMVTKIKTLTRLHTKTEC